jgi:hypothetical protein
MHVYCYIMCSVRVQSCSDVSEELAASKIGDASLGNNSLNQADLELRLATKSNTSD